MEATYIAESEERLRHDLEEKGLFLLSVQGGGAVNVGGLRLAMPRRKKIPATEFLVFNQELATLLKAGLPLVQSLDILRRRVPNPLFRATLDDIYDKVRSGTALSDAFEAQKIFSGVFAATSSMSMPPSVEAISVTREVARSTSRLTYSSRAILQPCSMSSLRTVLPAGPV